MFTRPTVFVLGAGASVPYGYPSGWELRNWILSGPTTDADTKVYKELGFFGPVFQEFQTSFLNSACASIDDFLESRNDLDKVGRTAIALQILKKENKGWLPNGKLIGDAHSH